MVGRMVEEGPNRNRDESGSGFVQAPLSVLTASRYIPTQPYGSSPVPRTTRPPLHSIVHMSQVVSWKHFPAIRLGDM